MSALGFDLLAWLIVGLAALYVGRSAWTRIKTMTAHPEPTAGMAGPMGSTLTRPGAPASGCSGCSGSCGSSSRPSSTARAGC